MTIWNEKHKAFFIDPVWDDLRFPAAGINPPGGASDPDRDSTNGWLLFASNSTEVIACQVQLPHAWWVGSPLYPHIHWMKTTSAGGDVLWQIDYKWAAIGEVLDASWTTLTSTTLAGGTPDNDTAYEHLITSFDKIYAADRGISDMLIFRVSRIGGNAADTYGADCALLEFDLHYALDTLGSDQVFQKNIDHGGSS